MRKKALLVTTVSGFVPQFEMENVRSLQDMGYEVHYATNYHNVSYGTDNHRLDGTGIIRHQVDFVRSPYDIRGNVKAYRQLKAIMEQENFQLLHCHTPMGGALARLAGRKFRKLKKNGGKAENGKHKVSRNSCERRRLKVVYTAHGFHFFHGAGFLNWLVYFPVERWLSRYTDVQVTINHEDYLRAKRYWYKGCKVVRVPGVGIDADYFDQPENFKRTIGDELRRRLRIGKETFVFLSVGELIPRKNHIAALRALAKAIEWDDGFEEAEGKKWDDGFEEAEAIERNNFKYIICGHGELERELKKRVKQYGLSEYVIFTGYCEDIREFYYACDCFVFPSLQEGLPMALLEAVASGCKCIVSDIRGNRDIARSFPKQVHIYKTESELAAGVKKVMLREGDPQKTAERQQNQRFSKAETARRIKRVYQYLDK